MTPRMSVEEVAFILAAHTAGATQWQIRVALHRDAGTIRRALQRLGVRSRHTRLTPRQKHELLRRRRLNPREPVTVMAQLLGVSHDAATRFLERTLPRNPEDRRRARGTPTKYRVGECGRVASDRRRPIPSLYRCPCGNTSTEPRCITCQKAEAA
jgi:hypothetical protein